MSRNEGITQKQIIKILLLQDGHIEEPTLRETVKKELKLKDDSNIRRELKALKKLKCITQIPTNNGFSNVWDISTPENLKNIKKHFPDTKPKNYKKSLIIACSRVFDIDTERGIMGGDLIINFKNVMRESESFFWACVENDWDTLSKRWLAMFGISYMFDVRYQHLYTHDKEPIMQWQVVENAIEQYVIQDISNGVVTPAEVFPVIEINKSLKKDLILLEKEHGKDFEWWKTEKN